MILLYIFWVVMMSAPSYPWRTPMQIKTSVQVTPQMIADQMVMAIEGGSNYWCSKMRLKATAVDQIWYACPKLYEDHALQIAVWDEDGKRHTFGRQRSRRVSS